MPVLSGYNKQGYCDCCQNYVLLRWKPPALLNHGMLTFFTCGLWLPILLLVAMFGGGWVCHRCGSDTKAIN